MVPGKAVFVSACQYASNRQKSPGQYFCCFIECWKTKKLYIPPLSGSSRQRKRYFLAMERCFYYFPVFSINHLLVYQEWWRQYIGTKLRNFPECFTSENNSEYTAVVFWVKCYHKMSLVTALLPFPREASAIDRHDRPDLDLFIQKFLWASGNVF